MTHQALGHAVLLVVMGHVASVSETIAQARTSVSITAALVDKEMQVRPVPLHALRFAGEADTVVVRTGVDGKVTISIRAGKYALSSVAPLEFQDRKYQWAMDLIVPAGSVLDVALTNDNATVVDNRDDTRAAALANRVDPAASLFAKLGRGVFRIQAGLAHGSGFLVDTLGGVVLTNAHVVESAESNEIFVVLDSVSRVHAQLLSRDGESDVAVLRVALDRLGNRPRLRLQNPGSAAPVVPGERLAAMGYPLNQELTITSGIASSVRAGAIISDVNINHGNSGGPLLNVDGEVVAINTFGDLPSQGGPGISGSILVSRASAALTRAAAELVRLDPVSSELLPTMPHDQMDMAALKAYADTVDPRVYKSFSAIGIGAFDVTIQTPAQTFVAALTFEKEVGKDRKKREQRAGLPEAERYSEVREYRDWGEYVGNQTTPLFSLSVMPRVGETTGSIFARVLLSPSLKATYKFKGDVRGALVFRAGVLVHPIKGGHSPVKEYIDDRWVSLKDVADAGFWVYDLEVLRPDRSGAPPQLVLAIKDLKSPNKLKCREINRAVLARAWNEFESFFQTKRPQAAFVRANPKAASDRKSAMSSGFLKDQCDWTDY